MHVGAPFRMPPSSEDTIMSKGMDQKKNDRKKPAKTLMEKRAAKAEKKKGHSGPVGQVDRLR